MLSPVREQRIVVCRDKTYVMVDRPPSAPGVHVFYEDSDDGFCACLWCLNVTVTEATLDATCVYPTDDPGVVVEVLSGNVVYSSAFLDLPDSAA